MRALAIEPPSKRIGYFEKAPNTRASKSKVMASSAQAVWVFVVCSVIGLAIEEVYCLAINGEIQDRAGLLFGPFSPIYGVGGVVIVRLARLLEGRPLVVCFTVFAVTGGAVEFATSWFMEFAFGMVAWDYSGTFLSLGGRTNGYFMLMWGLLGMVCMKVFVPLFDRFLFPFVGSFRYPVTKIVAVSMALNVTLTLVAFDCWSHRADGANIETPVQQICAVAFDDDFMESRFQTVNLASEKER